jgi:hypothetical protein
MKPAEHVREGHQEYFVAILVAHMQCPSAPVSGADFTDIPLNDLYGPLVRLGLIFDFGASRIQHGQL